MNIKTKLLSNDDVTLNTIKEYWYKEWSEKSMSKKIKSLESKGSNEKLPLLFVVKNNEKIIGTAGQPVAIYFY